MRGADPEVFRRVLRLAFFMCVLLAVAGQVNAERLPIKAQTTENGLPHNRVKRIVQDSHGFLWFCTAAGLSRFDGLRFINYGVDEGLTPPSINDVIETADGVYWIATNSDGVVRFDARAPAASTERPNRPRFAVYPVSTEPVANRVNVLYRDRAGTLWAGTDGGLFRLKERAGDIRFEPVPFAIPSHPDIQVQVWSFAEDRAGNLWIATKFGLVRRRPDGSITHYVVHPTPEGDIVAAVLIDANGTLWVGHRTGLMAFDTQAADAESGLAGISRPLPAGARRFTTADGLPHNTVLALHQTADRRLWIRTFGSSLTEFDGRAFQRYDLREHIGDVIGSLTEDREGNLWLGTMTAGALKILRRGWTTYDKTDGLGDAVASIFQSRSGELYVNSSEWRVSRFDGRRFTTVAPVLRAAITGPAWRTLSGTLQDQTGEWWMGSRHGLYRFGKVRRFEELSRARPKAVYTTRDGLPADDVTRLFEDSRGDIWIAMFVPARDVLVRWERATGRFHRYGEQHGLQPNTAALSFAEDRAGNVWVGFREGGLARYRDGRFTLLGRQNGVPTGGANGIYVDEAGRIWVVFGGGGLCRIDAPAADPVRVVRYTRTDGLATDILLAVTGDPAGHIYAASSRGIDRLDPATGKVRHYSTADGIATGEFTSVARDRDGALWFGTTTGLLRLVPMREEHVAPPPVRIGALRVAGIPQPVSGLGEVQMSSLRLNPNQNNIQIDFFGLGLRAGETLRYQYRLEGASAGWSTPAGRRSVEFAHLAPGAYRFLVRAVSPDGTQSTSPATVSFEILPPVWRRWWFITLAASLVVCAIAAFARYRYQRLKALRDSENRFRTLAETASDAIITIDEESRIVLVNHATETVFGYRREELIGRELMMLMPSYLRTRHHDGFARYRRTGQRNISWHAVAVQGLRKDGQEVPLEISFGEFTRDKERFFTGIARDVTERKRAEEALRRSREERLAELERVRKRIATDLHDDVGSNLTRISLLSEVVRQQVGGDNPSSADSLSSIARLSRELVDSMSDIVWAINPSRDHLSDLSQRMRHFVSDVCTARQIAFRFRTPPPERDIAVGANVRREVFLLFKEAVNNMVRHSGCSEADLEFCADDRGLVLRVSDNGHGFDPAIVDNGHGLRSMRERAAALGGHLSVLTQPGSGATLTFTIPLRDQTSSALEQAGSSSSPHEYAVTESNLAGKLET